MFTAKTQVADPLHAFYDEAVAECEAQGRRLCTEAEIEQCCRMGAEYGDGVSFGLHNELPVWTAEICEHEEDGTTSAESLVELMHDDGWTPYRLSSYGLSSPIIAIGEPTISVGPHPSHVGYEYGYDNMTNIAALNFRNVKLPRSARIQKATIVFGNDTTGSGHLGVLLSAVANCDASAVGEEAASNWSFPQIVPLCEDRCNISSSFDATVHDLTNDGICDDGGEGSSFDACLHGQDCSDCPPRGHSGAGLPDWPYGWDGSSRQTYVEWHPMDWSVTYPHDVGRRETPDLTTLLQPLVNDASWPVQGGCQVLSGFRRRSSRLVESHTLLSLFCHVPQVTVFMQHGEGSGTRTFASGGQAPGTVYLDLQYREPDQLAQLRWAVPPPSSTVSATVVSAQYDVRQQTVLAARHESAELPAPIAEVYALESTPRLLAVDPDEGPSVGGLLTTVTIDVGTTPVVGRNITIDEILLVGIRCDMHAEPGVTGVVRPLAQYYGKASGIFGTIDPVSAQGNIYQVQCVSGAYNGGRVTAGMTGLGLVHVRTNLGVAAYSADAPYQYIDYWSSPTTWDGGVLPREGDSVFIYAGRNIMLDVSPPRLMLIWVQGGLTFARKDLELDAHYIIVQVNFSDSDGPITLPSGPSHMPLHLLVRRTDRSQLGRRAGLSSSKLPSHFMARPHLSTCPSTDPR